jgi:predicted transcriptional regulator
LLNVAALARKRKKSVRTQRAIERAILETCRSPTVQHWIMIKARLGYETFWNHMNRMLSEGLLNTVSDGNRTLYSINENGLKFLENLE